MHQIVRREEMANGDVILNEVEAPLIAKKAKPGQFVILKADERGERIPLTMADADPDRGTITVIYKVAGQSTALFKSLKVGDTYQDAVGPLGQPTDLEKVGTVACVGGGTGVAVLYPITRGLKNAGNRIISIIGARTADLIILEEEMRAVSDELFVCTDDGSRGHHGFVTEILKRLLEEESLDLVVAVGPVLMMKLISDMTRPYDIKTIVSLNPIMIDGTGMCGGCRVLVDGENKFACVDGPEFDGHKVNFDQLMKRLDAYQSEERESLKAHRCRLDR
jgi:ferredoxin--NADP+ reductase